MPTSESYRFLLIFSYDRLTKTGEVFDMTSNEDIQRKLGKMIIEQLKIDYDDLSTNEKIELRATDIVDHLSVTYYQDKRDPDYDERVTN